MTHAMPKTHHQPNRNSEADPEALDYIRRAAASLKTAAQISPHLVTKLGTPHAQLESLLVDLEGSAGHG